jgi:tetratricopeptide (TPR) repeat protein
VNGNGRKERSLVAAQKLIERGQLDKAIGELAKVVEEDLTDTRTWLKMADLHAKLGANGEAAAIYSRMGEEYVAQGFAQKAVAVYKNALRLAPGPKVHLRLGAIYGKLGLVSDAVQQLELAAAALQRGGARGDAVAALRQAVAADAGNAVLRVKLAEAASLAGLTDEAVREFGQAAEQLKTQGRTDESLRVMERLLFHQPENTARARELAEAYIAKGSPRLALPKLQACLNASPREPRTLMLLSRALEQLGQNEKAVSVLTELARVCHELGRSADRDAAVAHALGLCPADAEAQALAIRHGVRGGPPGAGKVTPPPLRESVVSAGGGSFDLSGVGRRAPDRMSPHSSAAPVFVGEDSDHALPSEVGAGVGTRSSEVTRLLAESDVFVKYGLLERAVDHFARVFDIDAENREARERLAAVLQKLGRRTEAARHLQILAEQLALTQPAEARRIADRAAALAPAQEPGDRALVTPVPVTVGRDEPVMVSRGQPRPSSQAARHVDDDPNADVPTPPPILATPEDQATPLPFAAGSSGDTSGFERQVSTGDVLRVEETGSEDDPFGGDEPGTDRAVPPPGVLVGGWPRSGESTPAPRRQPEAPPSYVPVGDELGQELEQVAFFLAQSLPEDARALLADLDRRYPRDHRVVMKLREIEGYEARVAAAEASMAARRTLPGASTGRSPGTGNSSVGGDMRPSPRAFVEAGGAADASTHFDLAIAFKEMGLLDAAIGELKIVADDPEREVMALTMMGECYEGKGSFTEAVIRYKEALNCTPISVEETSQLYFLLGGAFDRLGDASEALYFFEKVARRDPLFRDVGQRIATLKPKLMKTVST